jgi:hypothetical protein
MQHTKNPLYEYDTLKAVLKFGHNGQTARLQFLHLKRLRRTDEKINNTLASLDVSVIKKGL